ncbi:unnamed protein product [Staurois parvus]|uniref:Uncharacterized protein n=1 Tax=Staurois parvus TaxID=386267 RepID=A0ABN9H2Y4_9NEOB|nr:unnamed protein product [Staurois parvus]
MLLPGPESLMGPVTASHCMRLHRHTLPMCHFLVLLYHAAVLMLNFLDIGVAFFCFADYGPPYSCCQGLLICP